jgi:SAM-dependent methyltransferase
MPATHSGWMKDNFSKRSDLYVRYRPSYPVALYEFLYGHCRSFKLAWDAGTGNGQVATILAQKFYQVIATDISSAQLAHATQNENVVYLQGAEQIQEIKSGTVDLITVAQAVHWFDREKFYKEVRRVATPHALLALWGYHLIRINSEADRLIEQFYTETIDAYWDSERTLVDEKYTTIDFPFEEVPTPEFYIDVVWDLPQLIGYLNSWSAVQHYISRNGENPVDTLEVELQPFITDKVLMQFPVFMRVGKVV